MRMNEREKMKRTKTANLPMKLAILLALFAVLIFTFSFAIFGDSLNFSSVASANEAESTIESGSSGGETASGGETGGAEAEPAAKTGGGTAFIETTSGITLQGSGTERSVGNFNSVANNMTTSTGSYYCDNNDCTVSNSATGDTYVCAATTRGTKNMFVAFNMRLKNTELAYLLANGGTLTATIEATLTNTHPKDYDIHGFGVYVGKLNSPTSAKSASDLTNKDDYRFCSKELADPKSKITIGENGDMAAQSFVLGGWNTTSATTGTGDNDGAIGLVVAFRVYQKGVTVGWRDLEGTISGVKLSLKVTLPSDSQAPANKTAVATEGDNLKPYKTTLADIPYSYTNSSATNIENVYTDFSNLQDALTNSLDSGAKTGSNVDELNLKSYTNSSIGAIGGYNYYKIVKFDISDNVMLKHIILSTSDAEKVMLFPYKQSSANVCMKSPSDNAPVYYYSYSKSSKSAATLTLYFYQNTKLTMTTSDYASGNGASTIITVGGIDNTTAANLSKISLTADSDETPYASTTAKLADAPWIYTSKQNIKLSVDAAASSAAPYVYYYRLYYS
ncbi:MAG: hypothetical protein MRZ86_02200, partial [Acidaminococcus sp.]|nr:hypothetical protein [Acidaminococcus sp.]